MLSLRVCIFNGSKLYAWQKTLCLITGVRLGCGVGYSVLYGAGKNIKKVNEKEKNCRWT